MMYVLYASLSAIISTRISERSTHKPSLHSIEQYYISVTESKITSTLRPLDRPLWRSLNPNRAKQ